MKHLAGRSVVVLGLGASGLAMAQWCVRHGARVAVWDSRAHPPMADALAQRCPQAVRWDGALDAERLVDTHLVLKSPGLAPHDPAIVPFLRAAGTDRIAVAGELDLFAMALRDLAETHSYHPKVLAITGTNGKTTTTALTALLLERAGRTVAVAGNIGPTLLDTLASALEAHAVEGTALPQVWVLELSSFQLDGVQGFAPDAAAVLNLTQDHLDWHGDMERYAQAKARIFGPALAVSEDGTISGDRTVMVVNRQSAAVEAMVPPPLALKGTRGKPGRVVRRTVVRFGLDAPQACGDFGCVQEGSMAWLVRAVPAEEGVGKTAAADASAFRLQRLMPADALRIRGRHNAANALAALALATAVDAPLAPMLHGLREYTGEPHRVEFIARVGEVEAFDDSKGTNVGATVAAIEGLGADRHPARLVVLLGGDGKGQDFQPLREPVARYVRAVALYGRDASVIGSVLSGVEALVAHHTDLVSATRWAFAQALPGDAVLLSPACASLDQFRDYKHRAEVFQAEVQSLAHDAGVSA